MMTQPTPIRIANCSGFYGDRVSAAREMVEGGPIDVLSGDWLAELTMLILARGRMKDPRAGFARTFLTQLEEVLGTCLDRGIRIVSNAGGLDPAACANAVAELAARLGLNPVIASVAGDDLTGRLDELSEAGVSFANLDTGEKLADLGINPITANAYMGSWGIVAALDRGADVVVTGRVTDAAVVVAPAAWRFGWAPDAWDQLAGAVVAGHIIECGAQCTGGNYAFFDEVPGIEHVGFPIAEIAADGTSVITKHPNTGGIVSVGTITAQLLYEIAGPRYPTPDVVACFDTIHLEQEDPDREGPDRVRVSAVRGEPAPPDLKVAINYLGGYRNAVTFEIVGLDARRKAEIAERTLFAAILDGRDAFDEVDVRLEGTLTPAGDALDAPVHLRVSVTDRDAGRVGRRFSNVATEMVLASYPGLHLAAPPGDAREFGVFWPTLVPATLVCQEVAIGDERVAVPGPPTASQPFEPDLPEPGPSHAPPTEATRPVPLGRLVGARSGDKGGNANVGAWARDEETFAWLDAFLTTSRLKALLPESAPLTVLRYRLPNLRALNFVIVGLLGRGVAASTRSDPQAKALGEELRAVTVDVPVRLLD